MSFLESQWTLSPQFKIIANEADALECPGRLGHAKLERLKIKIISAESNILCTRWNVQ